MNFEFDPEKSKSNLEKHGISFEQAQELWKDEKVTVIKSNHEGEERKLSIGMINQKCWTAISTIRNDKFRIISVRRSRKQEVKIYDNK